MTSILANRNSAGQIGAACETSAKQILREIGEYYHELQVLRANLSPERWKQFCRDFAPGNVTRELIQNGPITRGYFEKPRGYAGDPEALDLIYAKGCAGDEITDLAQVLYSWESRLAFSESIRARREFVSLELEEIFEGVENPRVLAVGAGHLREAEKLLSSPAKSEATFVAIDHDLLALEFLTQRFSHPMLKCVKSGSRQLSEMAGSLGKFHFIYALNLFDQLRLPEAQRLVRTMFSALAPGGRMLIANYAPDLPDAAFIEACMDWTPAYRDEEQMCDLTRAIPEKTIGGQVVFRDEWCSTVFLELEATVSGTD